jgi:hypothetical protein
MQLSGLEQPLLLSVEERCWPVVVQRFMVKGNGKRFPAGQWVSPRLVSSPRHCVWTAGGCRCGGRAGAGGRAALRPERVLQAQAVRAFQHDAGQSLDDVGARTTAVQAFAQAFAQAGQMPAYD